MKNENWFFFAVILLVSLAVMAAISGCTSQQLKPVSPTTTTTTVTQTATQTSVTTSTVTNTSVDVSAGYSMPITGWQAVYETIIRMVYPTTKLAGVSASDYCPNYSSLSDKAAFWVALIHWDSYYESGWNRTNQYIETGLDETDPITGQMDMSEGLEQLSYGDQLNYPFSYCKQMNYQYDKGLPLAQQTIMNPVINLGCTMQIFDYRANKYPGPLSSLDSLGAYWSSLQSNGYMSSIITHLKTEIPSCF